MNIPITAETLRYHPTGLPSKEELPVRSGGGVEKRPPPPDQPVAWLSDLRTEPVRTQSDLKSGPKALCTGAVRSNGNEPPGSDVPWTAVPDGPQQTHPQPRS